MKTHTQAGEGSPKLPRLLRRFFWDYDFESLVWPRDRELIIGRVLTYGSWEAVTWLRDVAGDHALWQWIKRYKGARMSPQRLRFWELILGLPHREVSAWLEAQQRRFWDRRARP